MGAYLCQISHRDWIVSRSRGIYGNKEGNGSESEYKLFKPHVLYSIIRDLAAMRRGDTVFFHVLPPKQGERQIAESGIHGVYQIRSDPYYDRTRVWKDNAEIFPYRFLFEPHPLYSQFATHDAYIRVNDFYDLIERRKIWSLATLENEINLEARSVRKIEGTREALAIIRTLHRDFRLHRTSSPILFVPHVPNPKSARLLRSKIKDIGRYENSIKALLMYKLGQNSLELVSEIGPVSEFMNEVFIAQTTRKAIDILTFAPNPTVGTRYVICEVKTDTCDEKSLGQLLEYLDLFKRKEIVNIARDTIVGCLIGRRFPDPVMDFCSRLNAQGVNGQVMLVKYTPTNNGTDANLERKV